MKPATRINEFALDIIEFCENDPYLYKELLKERENFLSATPEKYYKTTPLEVFLSKMLSRYNQQDQQILLGFKGHIFCGFTITRFE